MSKYKKGNEHITVNGVVITGDTTKSKTPKGYYKHVVSEIKKITQLTDKVKTVIFKDEIPTSNSIYFTVVLTNGILFEATVRNHKIRKANSSYRHGSNLKDEVKRTYYIQRHSSFELLREHMLDDIEHYYGYTEENIGNRNFIRLDKDLARETSEETLFKLRDFINGGISND